jgi:hypothetical protein
MVTKNKEGALPEALTLHVATTCMLNTGDVPAVKHCSMWVARCYKNFDPES